MVLFTTVGTRLFREYVFEQTFAVYQGNSVSLLSLIHI